jgi:fermentation-respiration switch protein FrsA (DUF1100 family)
MRQAFGRLSVYPVVSGGILLLLILAAGAAVLLDRFFVYFPERQILASPSDYGLAYDNVAFVTEDAVELHGWFVPGCGEVTLLWFHGNTGNVGHRLENLRQLHQRLGISVFLFDYRGYGRSAGTPSEDGLYRDAEAALAYLRARPDVRDDRIVYFGRSLGGAVAVDLASRNSPHGLILEAAFPSVDFMARHAYPFLPSWLVRIVLRARFDSISKITSVTAPVLMVHGERDSTVPVEAARKLLEAASEPKRLVVISGAGHTDVYEVGGDCYFDELASFLAQLGR